MKVGMSYIVWGHGRSWIVHQVELHGAIVWCSPWFTSRGEAEQALDRLCRRAA